MLRFSPSPEARRCPNPDRGVAARGAVEILAEPGGSALPVFLFGDALGVVEILAEPGGSALLRPG